MKVRASFMDKLIASLVAALLALIIAPFILGIEPDEWCGRWYVKWPAGICGLIMFGYASVKDGQDQDMLDRSSRHMNRRDK